MQNALTLRKHIQKYKHTHHLLHPAPSTHLQHVREHTVVNTNTNILLAPPTSDAPTPHVLDGLLCACACCLAWSAVPLPQRPLRSSASNVLAPSGPCPARPYHAPADLADHTRLRAARGGPHHCALRRCAIPFLHKERRTAPATTSAASSRSHAVRHLGLLAAAPPAGTKRSEPVRGAPGRLARAHTLRASEEGRALPAPRPARRRELAAARAARRDGAEGAALARRAAAAGACPRGGGLRRSRSQRPNRRSGTPVDLPAAAADGPTALLGGRAAPMQPAGGRASAARRAAPLLSSVSRCGPVLGAGG